MPSNALTASPPGYQHRSPGTANAAGGESLRTLEIWAEMLHVWHAFAGLLPQADEAVERIGRWLREDRPPGDGF